MNTKSLALLLGLLTGFFSPATGQDDLLALLEKDEKAVTDFTTATFKTTRIVIGQSVELPPKGDLMFLVTHHFGALNTGYENLFGLKQAYIRLGLEYGIAPWLGVNLGLNTDRNTWDGALKMKILRQSTGAKKMPLTLGLFANTAVETGKWAYPGYEERFPYRVTYAFQIQLARKFSNAISFQITPSMVRKNLVPTPEDQHHIFTLGGGGRVKISQRVSLNAEYHHLFPGQIVSWKAYDSFSLGVDIDTGGHIFQIFLTNSYGEYEQPILTDTRGKWSNGDIFLGFNITRMFTLFPQW